MTQRSLYGVIDFEQGFFSHWADILLDGCCHGDYKTHEGGRGWRGGQRGGSAAPGWKARVYLWWRAERPQPQPCSDPSCVPSSSTAAASSLPLRPAMAGPPSPLWADWLSDLLLCTLVPAAWMMDLEVESCCQRLLRLLLLLCCVTRHSSAIETGKTLTFLTPSPWDSRRTRGPHSVFKWRTCEKCPMHFLCWRCIEWDWTILCFFNLICLIKIVFLGYILNLHQLVWEPLLEYNLLLLYLLWQSMWFDWVR